MPKPLLFLDDKTLARLTGEANARGDMQEVRELEAAAKRERMFVGIMNDKIDTGPFAARLTDNKPAVAERIDLPGGYEWVFKHSDFKVSLMKTVHYGDIEHDGKTMAKNMTQEDAEAFAAAMRAEPAAPVTDAVAMMSAEQGENTPVLRKGGKSVVLKPAAPVTDAQPIESLPIKGSVRFIMDGGRVGPVVNIDPEREGYEMELAKHAYKDAVGWKYADRQTETPPGDVAMQAAREIGEKLFGQTLTVHATEVITAIIQRAIDTDSRPAYVAMNNVRALLCQANARIAQLEAAQAPAVCQSDREFADAFLAEKGFVTLEDRLSAEKRLSDEVARHRQAHEAAAWQKGCEYMREAAEDKTYNHNCEGYVCDCKGHIAHSIRALPIPPAPTGGRDNG